MKPNELRIGNFVKLKDCGTIVKVVSLTPQEVGYHYKAKNPICFYRKYSEIEGVLIYGHYWDIKCPNLTWCGYEDGDEMYLYYYASWPHKTFRFIHELQNIHYALTGEELKIEL